MVMMMMFYDITGVQAHRTAKNGAFTASVAVGAERAYAARARLRAAAAHARLPAAARGGVHPGNGEDFTARRHGVLPHQTIDITTAVRSRVPRRVVRGQGSRRRREEWCSVSIYIRYLFY